MAIIWASEFQEILPVLMQRNDLRSRVEALLLQPMVGKVTEGNDRVERTREVLGDLMSSKLPLHESFERITMALPRLQSTHAANNHVFAAGWEERLIRTQLSRLYNQATLEFILESGTGRCFVPHSSAEPGPTH